MSVLANVHEERIDSSKGIEEMRGWIDARLVS